MKEAKGQEDVVGSAAPMREDKGMSTQLRVVEESLGGVERR